MKPKTQFSASAEEDLNMLKAKPKPFDMFRLLKYVRLSWVLIIISLAISLIGAQVSSKLPDVSSKLFDGNFTYDKLWAVIENILITTAIGLVSYFTSLFAQAKSSQTARKSVWKKLINTKTVYYDANDPATLLNTVVSDAELMGSGFVSLFIAVPSYISYIISVVQIVSGYSKSLLWMILVVLFIHVIYMATYGQWIQSINRKLQVQTGLFTGFLAERIRNLPMIKTFSTQDCEFANGKKESKKLYNIGKKTSWAGGVQTLYGAFCFVLTTVISVVWGSALIRSGEITRVEFVAAFTYITLLNAVFMVFGIVWSTIKTLNGQSYRIARLCEAPTESDSETSGKTLVPMGDIKFNNVSFRYTKDKLTLNNVSFTVPNGKITALVGPSGSGKTTVVKLLERLYDVRNGSVTINGENINEFNLIAYRKKIAYVVQDAGIFSGSIRDCLTYGVDRFVTDEELDDITRKTGLYDYIQSLPLKYLTPIAGWGSSLSGGQRQRIVISRALLRNADILIFDEPTSALDPETANAISDLIFRNFDNKTVLIISHELNYITKSNNIVFLQNGEVEAEGNHEHLLKVCETYKSLVEEQSYQEVFE